MPEPVLRLGRVAYPVTALGPGRRLALWVAGCRIGCPGCISPELIPTDSGVAVPVSRLLAYILAIHHPLAGVTLTGGEPFDQCPALAAILEGIDRERPGWSVLAFSGYSVATLKARTGCAALLRQIDLLIAGRYERNLPTGGGLLASNNQRMHALTEIGSGLTQVVCADSRPMQNLGLDAAGGRCVLIGVIDRKQRHAVHQRLRLDAMEE